MSARDAAPAATDEKDRITLEDVKHRAEAVKDLAVTETKAAVTRVAEMDATQKALIVVGVAVAVIGLAYFMGTRAGRD